MTSKIYLASKASGTKHTYWVFDPDGNPETGDERVIRGGLPTATEGLQYVIEVDRDIDESRDALDGDDPFADRYYTTVFDGPLIDIEAVWDEMKSAALSLGTVISDPDFGGEDVVLLAEDQYWLPAPDCHTLTATIASSVGIDILANLPKVGGDVGAGERTPAVYYPGIEARLVSTGDSTVTVSSALKAYFDQGGEDDYVLDVSAIGPSGTVRIFEDSDTGTVDSITLQNVNPSDVSVLRTTHGELLVYVAGRDIPVLVIDGQFDGSGIPKLNTILIEPTVGSPVSVPVIDRDSIPVHAPVPLPSLFPGEIQPAFATAISAASPLVIDLSSGHTGVTLTAWDAESSTTFFDLNDDGFAVQTAWVSGDTGLLARDINSNGLIDSSAELFGSPTVDGFAKLAVLDSNHDLRIDINDEDWSTLVVWADVNGDAVTQSGELHSLLSLDIVSIDLAGVASSTSTISGNPISHVSTVTFTGGATAAIADAWFVHDNTNAFYSGEYTLDVETLFLPGLRGYGTLPDLTIAMSQDSDLKDLVADLAGNFTLASIADPDTLNAEISAILFQWAGASEVDPESRGDYVDAQHLTFLERMLGTNFHQTSLNSPDPWPEAGRSLEAAYEEAFDMLAANLLIQVGGAALFADTVTYNPVTGLPSGDLTLSETAIGDLVGIAPSPGQANLDFWEAIGRFIDNTRGITNLTIDELAWLDDAVTATDSAIGWTDVVELTQPESTATTNSIYALISDTVLSGTSLNDLMTAYGSQAITIHGNGGNDTINGSSSGDSLYGDYGRDTIWAGSGADQLYGDIGNDILYGEAGNDVLDGGAGGNFLRGAQDNDTYVNSGGDDYIDEQNYGGTDVINLASGITLSDLSFARVQSDQLGNYNDLLIKIAGGGSVQIFNQLDTVNTSYHVETVVFSNSTTLALSTITNPDLYLADGGASFATSTSTNLTVYGGSGNDNIYASSMSGDLIFDGGAGNDYLSSGTGDDVFRASPGFDTIADSGGADTIEIPDGYTMDDVSLFHVGSSYDLTIHIAGLGEIKISNQLLYSANAVETLHLLHDNSYATLTDLTVTTIGTTSGDSLTTPYANSGPDNVFDGREGDDYITGSAGDDTYIFSAGHDLVYEAGGTDTIRVRDQYNPEDVAIAFVQGGFYNDRQLQLTDADGNTLRVYDHTGSTAYAMERVAFADSTVWDLDSMEIETHGTNGDDGYLDGHDTGDASSDDTIYGYGGNDYIYGGNGDDLIYGGSGNDTIYATVGADLAFGDEGNDYMVEPSDDARQCRQRYAL